MNNFLYGRFSIRKFEQLLNFELGKSHYNGCQNNKSNERKKGLAIKFLLILFVLMHYKGAQICSHLLNVVLVFFPSNNEQYTIRPRGTNFITYTDIDYYLIFYTIIIVSPCATVYLFMITYSTRVIIKDLHSAIKMKTYAIIQITKIIKKYNSIGSCWPQNLRKLLKD